MILLLDTNILGQLCHPSKPNNHRASTWLQAVLDDAVEHRVIVPEICDYELRRKLLHLVAKGQSTQRSIDRLDTFRRQLEFLPLDSNTMLKAAEFWCQARLSGQPTASNDALDGDVILAADSKINVAGGAVTYDRGYAVTSQLKSQGALFDIGAARNDRVYDGVETWKPAAGGVASDPPARYLEESYREGRSAGSIRLDAANLVVRGHLAGSVTPGPRQRELGGTDASRVLPKGGELVLGNPDSNGLISNFSQFDVRGTIAINGTGTANTATPGFAQSLDAVDPQSGLPLFNAIKSGVDIDARGLTAAGF